MTSRPFRSTDITRCIYTPKIRRKCTKSVTQIVERHITNIHIYFLANFHKFKTKGQTRVSFRGYLVTLYCCFRFVLFCLFSVMKRWRQKGVVERNTYYQYLYHTVCSSSVSQSLRMQPLQSQISAITLTEVRITNRKEIVCVLTQTYRKKRRIQIHHHHQYSDRRPVLAGTRAQSGDRYGSGTRHSRQFLRGRLPLLSPAFRLSHFRLQVSPRASDMRDIYQRKTELRARNGRSILPVISIST